MPPSEHHAAYLVEYPIITRLVRATVLGVIAAEPRSSAFHERSVRTSRPTTHKIDMMNWAEEARYGERIEGDGDRWLHKAWFARMFGSFLKMEGTLELLRRQGF